MERRIAIVQEMVENGYVLFNETVEHFAQRFTVAQLEMFAMAFNEYRGL